MNISYGVIKSREMDTMSLTRRDLLCKRPLTGCRTCRGEDKVNKGEGHQDHLEKSGCGGAYGIRFAIHAVRCDPPSFAYLCFVFRSACPSTVLLLYHLRFASLLVFYYAFNCSCHYPFI